MRAAYYFLFFPGFGSCAPPRGAGVEGSPGAQRPGRAGRAVGHFGVLVFAQAAGLMGGRVPEGIPLPRVDKLPAVPRVAGRGPLQHPTLPRGPDGWVGWMDGCMDGWREGGQSCAFLGSCQEPQTQQRKGRVEEEGGRGALITPLTSPPEQSPPSTLMPTAPLQPGPGCLQRGTHAPTPTSPAPAVPARAGEELRALHFRHTSLPPHSPHWVSLSPRCTPGLPSPTCSPSTGCPLLGTGGGLSSPHPGVQGMGCRAATACTCPHSKQGRDQLSSLCLGLLLPRLSLKLPNL